MHGGAQGATAAGFLAGAAGLVLGCLLLLVPAGRSTLWRVVPAQAVAPVAALALVLLAAGGSLARAEAGPVAEAVRAQVPFFAVLRISGEATALAADGFDGSDRYLVPADVLGGVLRGESFASATPVAVIGDGAWRGTGTGDTVRVWGTAVPADRVGEATALFLPTSAPTIDRADGWLGRTDELRSSFRDVSLRDGSDGGLLPGMVLGDRAALDPALEAAMKATGLTHLTAVSGANCSYVVAFTFLGLRIVRMPRAPAALVAVLALVAFVLLVRPEPSVLRAAVMGAIGVLAVLSGRGRVSLTLLMLSIIVLLAVDPWLSVSFAFMLSVAATLGLVTAGPMVVAVFGRVLPRIAAQLLAIPLTAQLFCTPILVLIQPALPLYSLPANVLASPAVPGITLLGMLAVLALVLAPALGYPLIVVAQVGTRWISGVAEALALAPSASVPWLPGAAGAALAAVLSLAILVLLAGRHAFAARGGDSGRGAARPPPRVRRAPRAGVPVHRLPSIPRPVRDTLRGPSRSPRCVLVLIVAVVLGVAVPVVVSVRNPPAPAEWALTMCDVGQGDGLVLATTPGHALVVDSGPDPDAMDRCLDALGIVQIDALVITHLHEDHYGGIEGAVRGRTVASLYYSTGEDSLPEEVIDAAAVSGVRAERLDRDTVLDLDPLEVDVLWPGEMVTGSEENNASAVLRVLVPGSDRPVSVLLTGDLEEDAALSLLSQAPDLAGGSVDVLKIAHHGARNGGTALIEKLEPRLALISAGEDNDYGHPHPTIVDALDRAGVATVRTDELGSFTVAVVGEVLEVAPLN